MKFILLQKIIDIQLDVKKKKNNLFIVMIINKRGQCLFMAFYYEEKRVHFQHWLTIEPAYYTFAIFFFHIYVEWPIPSPIQISQLDTNLKCRDHAYPIDIYLFIWVVYAHKSQDLVYLLKKHLSVYNAYALIGIKL